MAEEVPVIIQKFTGINIREPAASIDDSELAECVNFNIGRSGEVEKRTGFNRIYNSPVSTPTATELGDRIVFLIGHYQTPTVSQLLATSINTATNEQRLYYSTGGSAWVYIGDYRVEHGAQYADKFYMVRADGVLLEWNGSAITAIAGSPAGTFCIVSRDRLFVLNTKAAGLLPSRLYFSNPGDFSTAGWPGTNFIDVNQGDGDFLVACALIQDLLIVFKGTSVWTLYIQGSPADWTLRSTNSRLGCISKNTVEEFEGFLYFAGARGIYRTDGITFNIVSDDIEPIFRNRPISLNQVNQDSACFYEDRYICLIRYNADPFNRYMIYNVRTKGWSEWKPAMDGADRLSPAWFVVVKGESPLAGVYCGCFSSLGNVYRYGEGIYQDAGISYECSFATKDFDMGQPSLMKRGKWLSVDLENAGNINWTHVVDGVPELVVTNIETGSAKWGDPVARWDDSFYTWGGGALVRRSSYKLQGPGYFRSWQLKFSTTHAQRTVFYSATLMMHMKRKLIKSVT